MHPALIDSIAALRSTRRHPQIKTLNRHRAKIRWKIFAVAGVALVAAVGTIFVAQRKLNTIGKSENRSPATAEENLLHATSGRAQSQKALGDGSRDANSQDPVVLAEERPDLVINFTQSARLKLGSRKNEYRMGELISLDAALINISAEPIFLMKLESVRFNANDALGEEIDVRPYVDRNVDATPDLFQLVRPGEMIFHTGYFLVGCDKQARESFGARIRTKDNQAILDRDLFVTWGEGCLDVKRPGTYQLFAEQRNEYVMVSESGNFRTAGGHLKSPLFTILVRE